MQALPKLEDYTPDQGAVILGDWIVTVTPVVGSLSSGAGHWFGEVLKRVGDNYNRWLSSDPVTRLTVRTEAIAAGALWASDPRYTMLEQRMTSLLLDAVPAAARTEIVAVRALTSVGILFLLHTRYQPAGQAEKSAILQFLVSPEVPRDSTAAIKGLRRWIRWLARSAELQLSSPDPSLLIKAVDKLANVHLTDPSAVFRVQTFRMQHGVEHKPTQASAVSLAQLYLAELETLALAEPDAKEGKRQRVASASEGLPASPGEPEKGRGKGKDKGGKSKSGAENQKELCRQFSTDGGCPRGNTCKYRHQGQSSMTGRCFNCGGKHLKPECTSPGGGAAKVAEAANPATKKGARKAQAEKAGESANDSVSGEIIGGTTTLGPSTVQAIKDAASSLRQELLKTVSIASPTVRASPLTIGEGSKGLIDGGATSCLRSAKSRLEWKSSEPTTIKLAVGELEARVNQAGTLLVAPDTRCDPIVALHELIRLGYKMTFLGVDKIRVWKPGKPDLQVDCSTGCPEVSFKTAMELITEVEVSKQVVKARVARLTKRQGSMSFREALDDLPSSGEVMAAWFKDQVPSIPDRLLSELAVPTTTSAAPWNRRKRRAIMGTKHVAVHLFAGESRDLLSNLPKDWMFVAVDIQEDLHDPKVFGFLMHLAAKGKVKAVIGGPPCRTFSALRHLPGGSQPLRGEGSEQWGLSGLSPAQQAAVDRDSLLFLKMFLLTSVARRALRVSQGMDPEYRPPHPEPFAFVLEQPEDPCQWIGSTHDEQHRPYPSCWRWDAWLQWSRREGATTLSLDQGPLGHSNRKPTTLGLIGPGWGLQPCRGPGQDPVGTISTTGGGSASLARWAPGLAKSIAAFVGFQVNLLHVDAGSKPHSPMASSRSSTTDGEDLHYCAALTRAERAQREWAQHLAQDHLPRRRDCFHCLAGEFQHKPHRRNPVPQAYCLGVDLLGPMMPGQHEPTGPKSTKQIKYGLVAVYTFPKVVGPALQPHNPDNSSPPEGQSNLDARGGPPNLPVPTTPSLGAPTDDTDWSEYAPSEPAAGSDVCNELEDDGPGVSIPSADSPEPLHNGPLAVDDFLELPDTGAGLAPLLDEEALASFEAPEVDPPSLPLTAAELQAADEEDQAWQAEWKDLPLPTVPILEIPFFVPLASKETSEVLSALMQVATEIKAFGLPLHRLHCDRGKEFCNLKVREWTRKHSVQLTTTTGDDWRANGRTENWVRLLKRSTRTLLAAHDAAPDQWSFAMRHACARLQRAALSQLGLAMPQLLPWHARLVLRQRTWAHRGPWEHRAVTACVLCPSSDVPGGHLVRTDQGNFIHTDALVEAAEVVELLPFTPAPPAVRHRSKSPDHAPPTRCVAASQRGGEPHCRPGFVEHSGAATPAGTSGTGLHQAIL